MNIWFGMDDLPLIQIIESFVPNVCSGQYFLVGSNFNCMTAPTNV